MRKILVGTWFALQVCSLWSLDIISGQAQVGSVTSVVTDSATTPNLITSPLSPVVNATAPEGFSGGSSVGYNTSTNTYYFGYVQQTIAKSIAINNALQGSGVQVNGVQYGMTYLNGGNTYGTLAMNVAVTSNTGTVLNSYNHTFNTQNSAWQQFDQTQSFTNPYQLANLGNVSMSITGKDSRFWAGYYGPQVKDPYLKLTYGSDPKTYYNIPDDGYVPVSLPFTFPFYGNSYTQSYMFSNGVVGFLDPASHGNGFCCDGVNLSNNPGSSWNFAIYALQTDLVQANPNAKFWTQGNSSYMTYNWENINEYGTNNLNTFSATIKPTGYIGLNHTNVNVQNHAVTIGIAGDLSLGQFSQYYNGYGAQLSTTNGTISFTGTEVNLCYSNPLSSPSCPGYQQAYFNQQCSINPLYNSACYGYAEAYFTQQCNANPLYSVDCPGYAAAYLTQQCNANPLYSTTCEGYESAYFNQQCSENPLYNSRCPGYDQAYLTQQCSINPLYSTTCVGYASAYFSQQCRLNPLYNSDCPGYATAYKSQQCSLNSLYATDCPGYQQAYFNQQCSLNPLYDSLCPGYGQAYFNQQCSLNPLYNVNCNGYTQAYHDQQCSLNSLYATDCPGYAAAFKAQQCTANQLYATDCPGYAKAYFDQQCNLNGLYDRTCPNYSTAYATKMLLEKQNLASTVATAGSVAATAPSAGSTTTSSDGTVVASSTGNSTVDKAIATPQPTANSAAAPAAPVQLVQPAPKAEPVAQQSPQQDKKPEGGPQPQMQQSPQGGGDKPQPTARQQLAERRAEAAKKEAVEKGKNLANEMGKVADMEAQKQVQNVVIAAMGFTPGFDNYNKFIMNDAVGYKPFSIYNNQKNVDNRRLGLGLYGPSDKLHDELVNSQFYRGN